MRILHTVESYYPSIGGMPEVVKQLSERFLKLGHDVTVATSKVSSRREKIINGVKIVEFNVSGNLVNGFKGDVENYQTFLLNSDFDIITNFAAQQWATDIMLQVIDKLKARKVLVPTGFSGLYEPQYRGYFESMKEWMKKYDMNVFLSNDYRDINFARDCGIKKMTVIPNGAGADEFLSEQNIPIRKILGIPESHFLILHVGSHTGIKGHSEAIKIFSRARIKNATFLMVGNDIGQPCAKICKIKKAFFGLSPGHLYDGKRFINTPLSRERTVAAYKAADLFLFPSNIECSPLVLFECMASKTPFMTTDVGNAKEIIGWSDGGVMLSTFKDSKGFSYAEIESSAKLLEELYNKADKRKNMQESGFKAWQEKFTWEKITKDYERLYKTI
jgi:glycosyltransferase involved in cell wall biosynthesis